MASNTSTFSNFTHDKYPRVKVLYNYEYIDDDDSVIWMKQDEVFYLLNNKLDDWWQVCRPDSPDNMFFVPSTYVQVLTNTSVNSVNESPPKTGFEKEKADIEEKDNIHVKPKCVNTEIVHNQMDTNENEPEYENWRGGTDANHISIIKLHDAMQPVNQSDCELTESECDYVNLEYFKKDANLPPLNQDDSIACPQLPESECEYANVEQYGFTSLPGQDMVLPNMENCAFERTLHDGWEVCTDIPTGRLFYHNKNTQQLQWRPPQGEYHKQLIQQKMNVHQCDESDPTKSISSDLCLKSDIFQNAESNLSLSSHRIGNSIQVSDRFGKAHSVMFDTRFAEQFPGPSPSKSATLPPCFTVPKEKAPLHIDDGLSKPSVQVNQDNLHIQKFFQSVNLNEPVEGNLKCKFPNGKKAVKKWTIMYVKLLGSNLLFYKDQKASLPKADSPHGKVDQMLSLVTCSLDRSKSDQGSKKTQILISNSDYQVAVQADDEDKLTEWFVKLHTKIKELGGQPDLPPTLHTSASTPLLSTPELVKKPSVKGKHVRKPSDGGSLSSKGKIKDVLNKFITNRSDKEKLRQRGIYREAVFGADLNQLCAKEKSKVPIFVQRSIDAIEKRGLDNEGIYRIGGNVSQIQKLRCIVDQGANYNLEDPKWDFSVLTGTLKLFFRELKDPLFTYARFDRFLNSFLQNKYEDRLRAIKATIGDLPENNYKTMKVMFKHLTNVIEKHLENKMASHQLAIIFGPTLIWPEVASQNLAASMVNQSRIVEFILHEYKNIFDE